MDLKLGCHCKDDNNSLYELIQCDFEDNVCMWLCNHILDMDVRLFLSTVQYSTVQYSTVQYSTIKYSRVQYSTVQYSTVR